jgi:RNA recognition motif-containing protein
MPFSMSEEDLRALFSQHGEVSSVNVIMDRATGRPRGFAFIEMSDDDAKKAMSALHEHEVDGRNLNVNEAKPRGDRDNRGGGRNRY